MWGAIHCYLALKAKGQADHNYLVMGPWRHSQVNYDGYNLGPLKWDGDTALQFRRDVLKPFFDQYLKTGAPKADTPPVFIYNTGENHWDRLKSWPLACETGCAAPSEAALSDRRISAWPSTSRAAAETVCGSTMFPIPRSPCPTCRGRCALPIADRWKHWLVTDQRAVDGPHRCADLSDARADRARAHQRRAGRRPLRLHHRHRRGLGGEADRRLPRRSSQPAGDGRL